jgi:hypothetical protein
MILSLKLTKINSFKLSTKVSCTIDLNKIMKRFYPGGKDKLVEQAIKSITIQPNSILPSNSLSASVPGANLKDINQPCISYSTEENPTKFSVENPGKSSQSVTNRTFADKFDSTKDKIDAANVNPQDTNIHFKLFQTTPDTVPITENSLTQKYIDNLLQKNLVEYNNLSQLKLTEIGQDIYVNAVKPKAILKNSTNMADQRSFVGTSEEYLSTNNNIDSELVVGTLAIHPDTEILSGTQQHLTVGKYHEESDTVTVGAFLTSEKGNKAGFAQFKTTTKVSEEKAISGEGGQYANKSDTNIILNKLHTENTKYSAETYNGKGITRENLESIEELLPHLIKTEINLDNTHEADVD